MNGLARGQKITTLIIYIPIFGSDAESYAIKEDAKAEISLIFHLGSEGEESLDFNCLTTMMMAIADALDISSFGGWRAYLKSL
jgi:hypothetical protein